MRKAWTQAGRQACATLHRSQRAAGTPLRLSCRCRAVAAAATSRPCHRCHPVAIALSQPRFARQQRGASVFPFACAPRAVLWLAALIQRERPSWPRPPARPQWASSGTHRIYVATERKTPSPVGIHAAGRGRAAAGLLVRVLAVALGAGATLDGKLGAAMQAAQAHGAAVLHPHRTAVAHLDGVNWALLRAQAASDTGVLNRKLAGQTQPVKPGMLNWRCRPRVCSSSMARTSLMRLSARAL